MISSPRAYFQLRPHILFRLIPENYMEKRNNNEGSVFEKPCKMTRVSYLMRHIIGRGNGSVNHYYH